MARRGNAAASGFSGQRLHDVRADDRQRRADHIAHEGHPDADGNERTGVGAGEDRRGGRTADVGERGHARGEEVELEDLTDVAAEQHREDHRVGEVVFQSGVCGLGLGHISHAQRVQEHGDEVAENDRRNLLEEFLHAAFGAFLQRDENGCHKEQHRHM